MSRILIDEMFIDDINEYYELEEMRRNEAIKYWESVRRRELAERYKDLVEIFSSEDLNDAFKCLEEIYDDEEVETKLNIKIDKA